MNRIGSVRETMESQRSTSDDPLDAYHGRDQRMDDRIIEAAVACFNRFGIRKTSIEDIAAAAKLSRPTIYRYFPSRNHLVVEVMLREVRDHTRLLVHVLKKHRYPPRALVEGIMFEITNARDHPHTGIIVSEAGSEMLASVPGSDEMLLEAMSEQWLPSLTRWRENGYLRPDLKMDDVVLWITRIIHAELMPSWIAVPKPRMRRLLATLLVPALFDFNKLAQDFPRESLPE